jgi:hypothetical protein
MQGLAPTGKGNEGFFHRNPQDQKPAKNASGHVVIRCTTTESIVWEKKWCLWFLAARLRGSPRRGSNFQLLLPCKLYPILRLPKEEFAICFIACARCVPFALSRALQAVFNGG